MANPHTPDSSKGGPLTEKVLSPSSKRSLDFNLWDMKSYDSDEEPPTKVTKTAEGFPIGSLQDGYCSEKILFRVTNSKMTMKDEGGITNNTLRFYGLDSSGEIVVTGFNDVFDLFASKIEVNSCYSLQNFVVKAENPKFPSYSGHHSTIKLLPKSVLQEYDGELPTIPFEFGKISEITDADIGKKIDLLVVAGLNWGLIRGDRDLTLTQGVDCIRLTLKGYDAVQFGEDRLVVVALRKVLVTKVNEVRALEARGYTLVMKNPPMVEAKELDGVKLKLLELQQQAVSKNSK